MKTIYLTVLSSFIFTMTTVSLEAAKNNLESTSQSVLQENQNKKFQHVIKILNFLSKAYPHDITPPEMLRFLKNVQTVTDFKLDESSKITLKNAYNNSLVIIDGVIELESWYSDQDKHFFDSIRQLKSDISKKIEFWPDSSNSAMKLEVESSFVIKNKAQSSVITSENSKDAANNLPK
jgi:hypothetical protein